MDWLWELPECPSTNTWAKENSAKLAHGQAVFTRNQTAGRGQYGREWFSPAGVLTVSFALDVPGAICSGFTLGVGLAMLYAVENLCQIQSGILGIKWPNDLYAHHRKLGGILCETIPLETSNRVIVGIGLNRTLSLSESLARDGVISLAELSEIVPSEYELLTKMRFYLLQAHSVMINQGLEPLLPELNRYHILQGRRLEMEDANGHGIVTGINSQGHLCLRLDSGSVITIASGRIRHWQK